MAHKAASDAHDRMERCVPDRFSASLRSADRRQSSLSSDLQFQSTGISNALRYSYSSAHAVCHVVVLEKFRLTGTRTEHLLNLKFRLTGVTNNIVQRPGYLHPLLFKFNEEQSQSRNPDSQHDSHTSPVGKSSSGSN